ncbi:Jerky -like [Chionoecetes opilio]|uniref:Jerky -like n=1 Tax=Chionoecetes opilio TaxID=41210 RepID=A0A8J4YVF3_CHIOP|nr:Jerky -like [Chionoecetes opilio]
MNNTGTPSKSSQQVPSCSASDQQGDMNSLHSSYTCTDGEALQESTITSEGKNADKNSDEGSEARKTIVIKEEAIQPPPHMLEPQTPTTVLTKRRRTVLSDAEKADLIYRMHEGESQKQLALEYGIGTSTVSDLKKHEVEILKRVETNDEFLARNRRKFVSGAKADVEEAILDWLLKEVSRGQEVSGAEVMARARQEHHRLRGTTDFCASTVWLERFKRRYNIRAFKPGQENSWRRTAPRTVFRESKRIRGRRQGPSHSFHTKLRSRDVLEQVFESSSPLIKSEVESPEESEYLEFNGDEELYTDNEATFQPLVRLEEGHFGFNIPPVEEIPSASEAASLLSKALVWAAAQQDTTPQELFVIKELQTKATMRGVGKNSP